MTAAAAPRVATSQHRYAFVLLGSVQVTLIFTLAAIAVPLPAIGRELGLERADLILLSAVHGRAMAVWGGLSVLGATAGKTHCIK